MSIKNPVVLALTVALAVCFVFSACDMEVAPKKPLKPIITPYISVPPVSASYTTGTAPADLHAQVWDWKPQDGELSYQWYRFTDVASFVANGGTPIPATENGSGILDPEEARTSGGVEVLAIDYALGITSPQAGSRYYYYLEVTNSDPTASDTETKSVRSEIATISFNAPGATAIPVITRHPANASYLFGRNMVIAALSVRAESPDGGDLTYQWYYDRTRTGNPGAAPGYANLQLINNSVSEDPRFYMPTVDLLVPGKNYFFVKVINTKSTSTDELSIPAIIDMEPGERPMEPEIEEQPEDKLYFRGTDTVGPVRVSAKPVIDGGTISYQWYSNTKPEARGGERVTASGGNTASFTPDIRGAGAYYYYAVVTNTNPSVKSSVKTATATSRAVKIVMAEPGSIPAASSVNATVTVRDPRLATNRFQYVRGYGGMDTAWANFPEQKPEDMETMYNPDWGMGFNINRIMISPANTNVNVTIRDLINRHRPYYYENVKIVNKYGGYNLASPWSPPKEWKSNNSINGGGILIYAYRQQYANYLRAFAKNMYDAGAPIYAISISNEPNYTAGYDGCEWTPDEMMEFFKEVNPKPYTKGIRGYGGGKETDRVLIVNGESANTPYINVPVLRDDVTRANVDLFARHVYGETTRTLWRVQRAGGSAESPSLISAGVANNFAAVAGNNSSGVKNILLREDGTMFEVWMTEHNINSANATAYPNDSTWNYVWRFMNDVDLVMRLNNENAFVWWASKRFYSMLGDGQFGTRNGAPLPRGIGLSHYAKYSIDTHRVNIDMTGTFADGKEIGGIGLASSEINSATFNLDNTSARITAYASIRSGKDNKPVTQFVTDGPPELQSGWGEIDYISLVMWTPTTTRGAEGKNLGTIQIKMPAGFVIGGVSAHKSSSATKLFQPENVIVHPDRESAYVTLNAGQILSVKLTRRN